MPPHAAGFLREEGHCQVVREEGNAGYAAGTSGSLQFTQQVFSFLTILEQIFLEKIPVKNGEKNLQKIHVKVKKIHVKNTSIIFSRK